ncbi:MAG TPA: carbohydrate ABC transporter permease [Bacillota bacterium]|nr:carbohydrate ABC transporter permease [Bacillota bacterium]
MRDILRMAKDNYHAISSTIVQQATHRVNFLKKLGKKLLLYLFLVDGAFVFLLPIIYMGVISVFTQEDLLDPSIRWIPVHFQWQNYVEAFNRLNYLPSLIHTLIATTFAILGQLLFCSLAGYALARMDFKGKKWAFVAVLLVLIIPAQAMTLPNFVFFARMHWNGTMLPITVPEMFGNGLYGALFVFIFRQVFSGFPKDLEDAAAIDGAGIFKTFFSIAAPWTAADTL